MRVGPPPSIANSLATAALACQAAGSETIDGPCWEAHCDCFVCPYPLRQIVLLVGGIKSDLIVFEGCNKSANHALQRGSSLPKIHQTKKSPSPIQATWKRSRFWRQAAKASPVMVTLAIGRGAVGGKTPTCQAPTCKSRPPAPSQPPF